jgi:hypothetical protein
MLMRESDMVRPARGLHVLVLDTVPRVRDHAGERPVISPPVVVPPLPPAQPIGASPAQPFPW